MESIWIYLSVFVASILGILAVRKARKKEEVRAQFVVTGTLLLIFYMVCFCSGVCTILNFLFRWIL